MHCEAATAALVETLLERGADGDVRSRFGGPSVTMNLVGLDNDDEPKVGNRAWVGSVIATLPPAASGTA